MKPKRVKSRLIGFFLCLIFISAKAQVESGQVKGTFKITGYETFGSKEQPDTTQKNDFLQFNEDKTCSILERGKAFKGTWLIDKYGKFIHCTLSAGKIKRIYRIVRIETDGVIFEYQTPDLVRTKYFTVKE